LPKAIYLSQRAYGKFAKVGAGRGETKRTTNKVGRGGAYRREARRNIPSERLGYKNHLGTPRKDNFNLMGSSGKKKLKKERQQSPLREKVSTRSKGESASAVGKGSFPMNGKYCRRG